MKKIAIIICLVGGCADTENLGDTRAKVETSDLLNHPRWALSFGGAAEDVASGAAIDPAGDVIVGGSAGSTVDFGGTTVAPGGWVTKRAADDGAELWTLDFTAPSSWVSDVGVADDGAIYVAGEDGSIPFVAKYDTDGQLLWSRGIDPIPGQFTASASALAVAPDGQVAVSGFTPDGTHVLVFDADGQRLWSALGTTGAAGRVMMVAIAPNHGVLVGGAVYGAATFAGAPLQATGHDAGYTVRFAADGALRWARVDNTAEAGPIAFAPDGTVISTSQAFTDVETGSTSHGMPQVTSLDGAGQAAWLATGVAGAARADAVTVLDDGTVLSAGWLNELAYDPGAGMLTGSLYLAAYEPDGELLAARAVGAQTQGGLGAIPWKLAAGQHSFAFAGRMNRATDFGTGLLPYAGDADGFIAVFDRD